MRGQSPCLARALHLDQTALRPEEVDDPSLLRFLEAGAGVVAIRAVALEQPVQEALRLRPLTALVQTPLAREVDEVALDLLARHTGRKVDQTASFSVESATA
jgi:hypothetical protein